MYVELQENFCVSLQGLMHHIWQKQNMKEQILGFRIFAIYLYLIPKTYLPLSNSQIPRI